MGWSPFQLVLRRDCLGDQPWATCARWLPLLPVLAVLSIWYGRTMAPGISSLAVGGWTDAAAMQVVGSYWGVAHPPGYPLYTVLANLFVRLVELGGLAPEPAWRVSLFSLVCALASLSLLYSLLLKLKVHPVLAAATAFLLGSGVTFWSYAITAEVYMMNLVLILAGLRLALAWQDAERERVALIGLGLVLGAIAAHHRTGLLLAPVLVAWMLLRKRDGWRGWPRRMAWVLLSGAPLLLFYVYLPLTASLNAGWTRLLIDPSDPAVFWFIVLGRPWWGMVKLPVGLAAAWDRMVWLAGQQSAELGGAVLLSLGVLGVANRRRATLLMSGLMVAFLAFGAVYWVADVNAMLIPLTAMLCIGLALFVQQAVGWIPQRWLGMHSAKRLLLVVAAALLLVLSVLHARASAALVDQSDDTVGVDLVETLRILAEDGVPVGVIAHWDAPLAAVQYARARYRLENLEPMSVYGRLSWYPFPQGEGVPPNVKTSEAVRAALRARWDAGQAIYYSSEVEEMGLVKEISRGLTAGRYLSAATSFPYLKLLLPGDGLPPLHRAPQTAADLPLVDDLSLVGYDQRWIVKRSGVHLRVALYWQAGSEPPGHVAVSLRPTDALAEALSSAEYPNLLLGSFAPSQMAPGEILRDVYELRLNGLPGAFQPAGLEVSVLALNGTEGSAGVVTIPIVPFPDEPVH